MVFRLPDVDHSPTIGGGAVHLSLDVAQAIADHFDLHGCDQLPVGEFLIGCERWHISNDDALGALRGYSPSTLGDRAHLTRIAAAVRDGGHRPTTLAAIRAISLEIAGEVDAYLLDHGCWTVTSYDPGGETLTELPDLLVASILGLVDPSTVSDPEATAAALRARVPEADRQPFDDLLAEARFAWGIRDDHVGITFLWPSGVLRNALLEVGRRLESHGRATAAAHALELHRDEIGPALAGGGPDQALLAERARTRTAHAAARAPYYIGAEPAPPSFDSFPRAMSRMTGGFVTCLNLWWNPPDRDQLKGVGVGRVAYRGTARVTTTAKTRSPDSHRVTC